MFRISQRSLGKVNVRQLTTVVQRNAARNVRMSLVTAVKAQQPWKLTSVYCAKRFYAGKIKELSIIKVYVLNKKNV